MRSAFPAIFFILSIFTFSNCKSSQSLKSSEKYENSLRQQIAFHVKCLNEGNSTGLEKIYSDNYEGLFPATTFESKQELINKIIESHKKQNIKIDYKIIELSASVSMAYAVLDWKAVSNFGKQNQDLLYNKKHLQIWVKSGKEWQLKRSLFYN